MVSVLEAIILGLVQGLTEWLPISSSAHLALTQYFFGINADVSFDIILHMGTLVAVLFYYRFDLLRLFLGLLRKDSISFNFTLLLVLAAIPTALIGLTFKDFFESMFSNPLSIAVALVITGVVLILASKASQKEVQLNKKTAFLVGVAQGISVAPGISRSGATISTALLLGVKKEDAARFSFLAGVLPIMGAVLLEGYKSFSINSEFTAALVGFFTSLVVGYLSIGLFLSILTQSKLQWFGYYCIALAVAVSFAIVVSSI